MLTVPLPSCLDRPAVPAWVQAIFVLAGRLGSQSRRTRPEIYQRAGFRIFNGPVLDPGICSVCRQRPPLPGLKRCQPCRADRRAVLARCRAKRLDAGKCRECGLILDPGESRYRCVVCRKAHADLVRRRRAERRAPERAVDALRSILADGGLAEIRRRRFELACKTVSSDVLDALIREGRIMESSVERDAFSTRAAATYLSLPPAG